MPPAQELTFPRPSVPALSLPRVAVRYRWGFVVLALAALSMLGPFAPTYDPWAWIIWGREILHLDLSTVEPSLAAVLKSANIIEIDDAWAGANRARIVQRWIAEVLNAT